MPYEVTFNIGDFVETAATKNKASYHNQRGVVAKKTSRGCKIKLSTGPAKDTEKDFPFHALKLVVDCQEDSPTTKRARTAQDVFGPLV